jgi:glyoxylase I family protein
MAIDRRSLMLGVSALALGATAAAEPESPDPKNPTREHVQGIGGFFFRSHEPKMLTEWYREHLGIGMTPKDYHQEVWQQTAGPTAFQPFPQTTKYFGSPEHSWMLNFRVAKLDAMVAQLRAANIAVEVDTQTYPNGRFAQLQDPEGNPIQLWEPAH